MQPLVSIVIPCYNSAEFIEETLQSVKAQTYPNIEIIAVDDASTDDTVSILKRCDSVQLVEFQQNQFVCKARMAGADLARGKYLLFLDSDDKIDPTFVAKCVDVLEKNPEITVCYSRVQFFGVKNHEWHLPKFEVQNFLCSNSVVMTAMMRKSAYDKVGGFDTNLEMFVDWELFISILKNGGKFHRIDEVLFFYRKRKTANSITDGASRNPQKVSDNYLRIFLKHYEFYKENGIYMQEMMAYRKYKDKYYNQWFKKMFYSLKVKK